MSPIDRLKKLVMSGLFAALIFLSTYLFHIPTAHGGYIHLGDTVIYLAASLLPLRYAAPCAAIGGALSDALSPGSAVFIVPTLIIKPLLTLFFTSKRQTIICKRNTAAVFTAGITGLILYDLASAIMLDNLVAPLSQLPIDVMQPAASGILFVAVGSAFDKIKLKQRFELMLNGGKKQL